MEDFTGQHCAGKGDAGMLKLIDDSLSMLFSTPLLPNIAMLYNPDGDTLREGFIWGSGFWLQNSYGFVYGSAPFLRSPWARIVQNSLDLHWDRIGDGKRIGADSQIPDKKQPVLNLRAPDGCLGDCAFEGGIIYKQGDGDFRRYDWFYEATAAALNMQADILLIGRDAGRIAHYLPLMKRSAEFIEGARDPGNNLFLAGPGCNLLAPSYGAARNAATGEFEKCYLAGLSITYCSALAKMVELFALAGDEENERLYAQRYRITRGSLPLLMTDEGYFVKYREKNGTLHGRYGQERYGYLEGVCNIDAIAFRVADEAAARAIYDKIASVPEMRPFDFLVNNYPGLDDAPWDWLGKKGHWAPGDWVDGGCWGTVEGRALLAYLTLGRFEDAFRSARRNMKWAEDYRMDEPFSQWGENRYNSWANEKADGTKGKDVRQTGVMIDNFAIAACLIRGLLGCTFDRNGMKLDVRLPAEISSYSQHVSIRYGGLELFISVVNGASAPAVTVNGSRGVAVAEGRTIRLDFARLEPFRGDRIELAIDLSGGAGDLDAAAGPSGHADHPMELLPDHMARSYASCLREYDSLDQKERGSDYGIFLADVIAGFRAAARRRALPFDKANFRPMTRKKREEIISLYDISAMNLYRGLKGFRDSHKGCD